MIRAFSRDMLHALRSLAKTRAYTFVCVVSLGIGMGTVIGILILLWSFDLSGNFNQAGVHFAGKLRMADKRKNEIINIFCSVNVADSNHPE